MKYFACLILILSFFRISAQQHFAGMTFSNRGNMVQAGVNPAEYANFLSRFEFQLLSVSANAANNKIGFGDLFGSEHFEELIFRGTEPVNLRFDGEIYGPGVAYSTGKWTFALTSKAYAKLDLVDVDVHIGDAISSTALTSLVSGPTVIDTDYNQRVNGTSWGEIGVSAARELYQDATHKVSGGATVKLLFPGSYANFGADRFQGTISNTLGDATLTDASANLNIAYSGNLGDDFTDFSDYTKSLFGKPNGYAIDLGINYRLLDRDDPQKYRVNAGLSLRNLGAMTFRSSNNSSTDYVLSIQGSESLDLNQFQNVENLEEIENILLASGYLDKTSNRRTSFKVKLPAVLSAYADVRIVQRFHAAVFVQQKLQADDANDQITYQNVVAITPRFALGNFEVWSTWSRNQIAGVSGGLGLRAYGFYLGSGSILTNLFSDNMQADAFIGYSFALQ